MIKRKKQFNQLQQINKPENLVICDIIREQNRYWEISDGSKAELNKWYKSKRGHLVFLKELLEDGSIIVKSHITGNLVLVPPNQVLYFTKSEDPGTPCGTIIIQNKDNIETSKYDNIYNKYPHIIPGSIYRMQNTGTKNNIPKWKRKRKNERLQIKGQVRCKIICQESGCNNTRDIKIQDVFQVKKCNDCKNKSKKKKLKKFLNKKVSK